MQRLTFGQRFVIFFAIVVSAACFGVLLKIYQEVPVGAPLEQRIFLNAIAMIPLLILGVCLTVVFLIVARRDSKK